MTPTTDTGDKLVATEPIHCCMTKGVKGATDQFEYGLSWVTSRRAILKVFPYSAIEQAVLLETKQWFIPCYVLKVQAADSTYQFGLNPNKFWKGDLPFQAERQKGKLKYSAYSIAIRVVLVVGLIWYFYTRSR